MMIPIDETRVVVDGLTVRTEGLRSHGRPELHASVNSQPLIAGAVAYLHYVVDYIRSYDARLRSGEKLAYGYWLTQFVGRTPEILDVWELDLETSDYVPGVTTAVTCWTDQHTTCTRASAAFTPPMLGQLAVISDGVYEGNPVQGVRYPSPDHMSGWWITTDRYNGDIKSLRTVHLHHVSAERPELTRYLALPYGFRFSTEHGEDFWLDDDIASSEPE